MSPHSFERWIPALIRVEDGVPVVHWYLRGRTRFDGGSFTDILQQGVVRPFNQAFARRTPLDDLESLAESAPSLPLRGIVAHTSRCGSTAVGRMLAADGRVRVVAEAGPIDTILRLGAVAAVPREQTVRRLRAMIRLLGRPGSERETAYVLKLDAWQTADLARFEEAVPGTPWIFMYRDPVETLVSHMALPSYMMSAAHAPVVLDMPVTEAIHVPRPEFCARVLERICIAALENGANARNLVDHAELPGAVEARIAPLFGLDPDDAARAAMRSIAGMNAKQPGLSYEDDGARKRTEADDEVRAVAKRYLDAVYARLRAARSD